MTYPASPNDARTNRVRPDSAQFWAGAVATAVVAALIALVGILICRWTLGIPILAPQATARGAMRTPASTCSWRRLSRSPPAGVLYLLVLGTPQPGMFFDWIMGLATLAAVVYPFSTGAPLDQKAATAVVDLVLGIAITSLLTAVAARAVRRRVPPATRPVPATPMTPATAPSRVTRAGRATCPGSVPWRTMSRLSRSTCRTAASRDAGSTARSWLIGLGPWRSCGRTRLTSPAEHREASRGCSPA